MSVVISTVMNTMKANGFPIGISTEVEIKNALQFGFRGSQVEAELKRALMVAGVQIFIEDKVPEPEKPVKRLEFSQHTTDWLLSLQIPGAAEAMKMAKDK